MITHLEQISILTKISDAPRTLAKMNLNLELLLNAVKTGHAARANITPNHPRTSGGYYAYSETNCGLSSNLINEGWTRREANNIPILIHPSGAYQIVVSSGDIATGTEIVSILPSTQREKGIKFSALFGGNSRDLFDKETTSQQLMTKVEGQCPTYILLYYYDERSKETRCELSLPTPAAQSKFANKEKLCISEWACRIILGSVGGEPDIPPAKPDFTDDQDFNIVRKIS